MMIQNIKESICKVNPGPFHPHGKIKSYSMIYKLPDGSKIETKIEIEKIPEILFRPNILTDLPQIKINNLSLYQTKLESLNSIIIKCIRMCDTEVRQKFCS